MQKDAKPVANSRDLDQTPRSGSIFAKVRLPEYLS